MGMRRRLDRLEYIIRRPRNLALEACRHDRVAFARLAGVEPDGWQQEVLRSMHPRKLLNCARQSGKTTVVGIIAAHTAIFEEDAMILMVASVERQAGELFRRMMKIYRKVGSPVPAIRDSSLQLELANGARVIALPGKEGSIRSYSGVGLLMIDEASRVLDETYATVRPMMAVAQGNLLAMSTPFGARGWWHAAYMGEGDTFDDWVRWEVPAEMCPRITPKFLAEEKRNMGEWVFEQEYHCRFLDPKTAAFRQQDIDRVFKDYDTWDLGA